jgi:hypothetical protein
MIFQKYLSDLPLGGEDSGKILPSFWPRQDIISLKGLRKTETPSVTGPPQ